jgi:hypothetical protein
MKTAFWTPKKGEDWQVRLIEPDTIVECIDNTGVEGQFDKGIEYVFEGSSDGPMISVFNKLGELRSCFSDRFRIVSKPFEGFHRHFRRAP